MFLNNSCFDVIVIGGGHAGIEASYISSKLCDKILLITYNIKKIGEISCNPSIGGIGKSHLVKEIDAFGGIMGRLADLSAIQYNILNTSKGYAVRSTRIQIDKNKYKFNVLKFLKSRKNIFLYEGEVTELLISNNSVVGVVTNKDVFFSKSVILSTGTFLDGKIFIGNESKDGGRLFDHSSKLLASFLKTLSLNFSYLKTGTPPRLDINTINFDKLKIQKNIDKVYFSNFYKIDKIKILPQIKCFLAKTNKFTHKIILKNLKFNPLYNGLINSIGPRYCPSIEDKVVKFPDRDSHQVFLEKEELYGKIIYPNGISTSFSLDIQKKIVNSIIGMEESIISIPGYAVEYLYFDTKCLHKTLESKLIKNLFFAGQINGTTGYEEAAAQGLVSGVNAAFNSKNKKYFKNKVYLPDRSNSYIGVLIDDLCTKGVTEPYRMFTARSEYRIYLREDNADYRLTPIARKFGLIDNDHWFYFKKKMKEIKNIYIFFKKKNIFLNKLPVKLLNYLSKKKKKISFRELIINSNVRIEDIVYLLPDNLFKNSSFLKEVEIFIKYEGYCSKQSNEINKFKIYENIKIPLNIKYENIIGLSKEVIYKLNEVRPDFLGQLYRIPGITPVAILILLVYLKKKKIK